MHLSESNFETEWDLKRKKLRSYFVRNGVTPDDVDDLLQDTARKAWFAYVNKESSFEQFISNPYYLSKRVLLDWWRQNSERRKIETPLSEFSEAQGFPFADLWGRRVPNKNCEFAEKYSIAPLDWSAATRRWESIVGENYPVIYYLSIGASFREIAALTGLPVSVLKKKLSQVGHRLVSKGEIPGAEFASWGRLSNAPPLPPPSFYPGLPAKPTAPSHLRKLAGYVPEWITWFVRLSDHTTNVGEPITFGLIRQLAGLDPTLTEEQGRRFLIAASSEDGALLSQKFIQIPPYAESRDLSFKNIYRALRREGTTQAEVDPQDWMDRIVTFWEPKRKWTELKSW